MIDAQKGNGDYTLLHNGKIYRFPTESERWEFLQEEANDGNFDHTLIITHEFGAAQSERQTVPGNCHSERS
jgi:hypothetical protein